MATRRNRIKGILNIPTRRNTGASPGVKALKQEDVQQSTGNEDRSTTNIDGTNEKDKCNLPEKTATAETFHKTVAGLSKYPGNTENTSRIDIEPPPSPTKINRTRIKAIPRLGQRRVSFSVGSASESDDDGRRQSSRHRNDSVCSLTSNLEDNRQQQSINVGRQHVVQDTGAIDSLTTTPNTTTVTTSPVKKEFNCVIQRKCRRTEQARKLATAKRDFFYKFKGANPDRHRLTMMDLIFYNPTTSPMSADTGKDTSAKDDKKEERVSAYIDNCDDPCGKSEEEVEDPDDQDDLIAPQVTVNADGEIIIDERSLLIENKRTVKGRQRMEEAHLVDGDENTGYGIYKRVKRTKDWTKIETLRFYKALNTIGTDFTLMVKLFPNRTRRELKMKFKKEERINHTLIDKAVLEPVKFDMSDLEADLEKELLKERELELRKKEVSEAKCAIRERRQNKSIQKHSREDNVLSTIEDNNSEVVQAKPKQKIVNSVLEVLDDSDENTESEIEEGENSKDSEDYFPPPAFIASPIIGVKRPKRNPNSRHIYKKTKLNRVDSLCIKSHDIDVNSSTIDDTKDDEESLEPGSLMIVKNTEQNSTEPEFKIFMITADKKKVAIDLPSDVVKSLATNTGKGATLENHNIILGVENNYTINEELEENNFTINEEQIDGVVTCDFDKQQVDGDILILPLD